MDQDRPAFPRPAPTPVSPAPDTERLAARIVELRAQLAALAPAPTRSAEVPSAALQERVVVLERLLGESRAREEQLTAQLLRGAEVEADLHARVVDLSATVARTMDAEVLLNEAMQRAEDAERRAVTLAEQARAHARENETLHMRVEGLETDLHAAVTEVAASAGDRVRAAQLVTERDEARADAEAQRAAVVEGRLHAAEVQARITALQERVAALQHRVTQLLGTSATPVPGEALVDLRGVDEPSAETETPEQQESWRDGGWA